MCHHTQVNDLHTPGDFFSYLSARRFHYAVWQSFFQSVSDSISVRVQHVLAGFRLRWRLLAKRCWRYCQGFVINNYASYWFCLFIAVITTRTHLTVNIKVLQIINSSWISASFKDCEDFLCLLTMLESNSCGLGGLKQVNFIVLPVIKSNSCHTISVKPTSL